MTGKSDNDFVGFYRIYENGKATNKWSSKFENQSRNKEDFKTMIGGVQSMLPQGHEYTEKTSISTDGLRLWNQQLNRGYELQYDNKGNLITNRAAINGDAIINDLGVEVNKGNFDNISVKNSGDMKKVKAALLPYLQNFGLNESNIHFENGTVEIDLPVLKNNKVSETTTQEVAPLTEEEVTPSKTTKQLTSNDYNVISKKVLDDKELNTVRASLRASSPDSFSLEILDAIAKKESIDTGNDDLNQQIDDAIENGLSIGTIANLILEDDVITEGKGIDSKRKAIDYALNIGGKGTILKSGQQAVEADKAPVSPQVNVAPYF